MNRRTLRTILAACAVAVAACSKKDEAPAPETVTLPGPESKTAPAAGSGGAREAASAGDPAAEALPPAEGLLAKVVDAVGGADRLSQIESFVEEAEVVSPRQNLRGTVRMWWQRGDFYVETNLPGVGVMRQGKKGDVVWSEDPIFGPRVLDGEQAEQAKWQAKLTLAHRWQDDFDEARTVAKKTVDGRTVYEVELSKKPDTKVTLLIDATTYEIVGQRLEQASPMGKTPVEIRFADVREVAGIKMPFRIEIDTQLGKMVHTVKDVKTNVPIDPSKFEMPKAPAGVPHPPQTRPLEPSQPVLAVNGPPRRPQGHIQREPWRHANKVMTLTRIKLERFTAFEHLDFELSAGINIFIGENGTGKTHLLKVAYAACDITKTKASYAGKLLRTFLPYQRRLGRLVHRTPKSTRAVIEVYRGNTKLRCSFTNHAKEPRSARITGKAAWTETEIESAYIPVKEMLANAPGFLALYELRDVEFEEVYRDIILRSFRGILRGPHAPKRRNLLGIIQKDLQGKVVRKEETFFLKNKQGELEFALLAEGMRKLALLWLLIQNGTLLDGSVLFWDEPEANLNPKKMGTLVEILLELQRMGVQILLATHDYVLLKEFDLRMKETDAICFHALYRDSHGKVQHQATNTFLAVHPNAVSDTFADLYERDVRRALKRP